MDNATQATQAHGLTAADVFGAATAAASNLHMGLSAGTMMLPTVAFTSSSAQSQLSQSGNALSSAVSATPSIPYFSWPPQQPIINIPFFDANLYKTVNLDAQPSCLPNGMDLPLNDITTLRFFFNMGVNHARAVLLSQHVQQALSTLQSQQQQQTQSQAQHQLSQAQTQTQSSVTSTPPTISQNPIGGLSTNALQNEQQLHLLNQFRPQPTLVSQKMNAPDKLRDVQQQQATKSYQSLPTKSLPNSVTIPPFISTTNSLTSPIEALLLQNALLNSANGARCGIDLAQLRYQLALNASAAQGLLAISTANGTQQTSSTHELIKPIAVSAADVQSNPAATQVNGAVSPRPPVPVDPAPLSETILERTIRLAQQDSLVAQQLNELQQQAILSLRQQPVDTPAALQAAQIAVNASTGQQQQQQQQTREPSLNAPQQIPSSVTSSLSARQPNSSTTPPIAAVHPFAPSPIRPTPTHQNAATRDDIPLCHSLLAATEMHYNETFKKTQGLLHDSKPTRNGMTMMSREHANSMSKACAMDSKIMEQDEQKNNSFQPQLMINLLNGVLSKVKNELHQQGVDVHLDATGRPIDFSARPVDPIFRRAREQLENSREYRDATSPPPPSSHHMSVDRNVRRHSASLKEVDVVRQASERIQNSALHAKSSTHNVASTTSASISTSSTNSESIAHSPLTTKINSPASSSVTARKASPARPSATSTDLSHHGSTKATKADRCSSKSPPGSRISPAACRSPANTSAISLASPPTLTAVNNSRPGSSDRRNSSSDSKHHTNSDVNHNNSSKNTNDNDHSHGSSASLHGTKTGSLSTDSEELNPKEEKVLTENTNGMNRVFEDDYDTTSDYSPDEKRLRIASVEDE